MQRARDLGFLMNPGEGAVPCLQLYTPPGAASPTHLFSGSAGAGGPEPSASLLRCGTATMHRPSPILQIQSPQVPHSTLLHTPTPSPTPRQPSPPRRRRCYLARRGWMGAPQDDEGPQGRGQCASSAPQCAARAVGSARQPAAHVGLAEVRWAVLFFGGGAPMLTTHTHTVCTTWGGFPLSSLDSQSPHQTPPHPIASPHPIPTPSPDLTSPSGAAAPTPPHSMQRAWTSSLAPLVIRTHCSRTTPSRCTWLAGRGAW